ncbi:MAG: (4Fe-4S)-binding protein [Deltaproteobacteria bacterium]|nr:(4Fe-4S)-binding protein [Deltaproteobacteria bacterium]
MVKLLVDDREIEVKEGTTLLKACIDNDIYIPNLCFMDDMKESVASCRMCFVEVEGEEKPVTSCTVKAASNMTVRTDTPVVRRLQRSAFRLLLSTHHVDCRNCQANKNCELQEIAKLLKVGLKQKSLQQILKDTAIDESHPCLIFFRNRCVLCGKCISVCKNKNQKTILTFVKRGFDTVVGFYGAGNRSAISCGTCKSCVEICPVGAITLKESSF